MPQPKRGLVASAPERSATTPGNQDPEKVPTYAQQHRYIQGDEGEKAFRFSQEQERELVAEGIWPERQWSIWRHAMQRGIQSY
jgi:hypothetical protein